MSISKIPVGALDAWSWCLARAAVINGEFDMGTGDAAFLVTPCSGAGFERSCPSPKQQYYHGFMHK
jgi:hypothetical protein